MFLKMDYYWYLFKLFLVGWHEIKKRNQNEKETVFKKKHFFCPLMCFFLKI